jgi:phage protein U
MGSVTGEFELHRSVDDGQSKFHSFGKPQKEIEELEFDRILEGP